MAETSDNSGTFDSVVPRLRSLMSAVNAEDFDRFEPPARIWSGISLTIGSTATQTMVVEYWIDADDRVFATGDGWVEFALENGAPELVVASPERTLWSYFDTEEVRELWQVLVARVRSQQVEAKVPLRCDAPDMRRWFEMTIAPGALDTVRFTSVLLFEESRPAVALLDVDTERMMSEPAIAVCGWCAQAHDGSSWMAVEELVRRRRLLEESVVPRVEYGICPSCRDAMSVDLLVRATVHGDELNQ